MEVLQPFLPTPAPWRKPPCLILSWNHHSLPMCWHVHAAPPPCFLFTWRRNRPQQVALAPLSKHNDDLKHFKTPHSSLPSWNPVWLELVSIKRHPKTSNIPVPSDYISLRCRHIRFISQFQSRLQIPALRPTCAAERNMRGIIFIAYPWCHGGGGCVDLKDISCVVWRAAAH